MARGITAPGIVDGGRDFACSLCEEVAGHVELLGPVAEARVVVDSFVSRSTTRVDGGVRDTLLEILSRGDAAGLHAYDAELAPFYCPGCRVSYCGSHWTCRDVFDSDGWHDSIRGSCPQGHDRMLED